MVKIKILSLLMILFLATGCDMLYSVLHKPGGEERKNLGEVVFNQYNPKVEELQQVLKIFGYNIGRADGKFGAGTRDAVARFQAEEDLTVTRFVDKATWERIEFYRQGPFFHKGHLDGRAVQKALKKAGYDPGKIDGQLGGNTREAIKSFQQDHSLSPDGQMGLKTLKALSESR
ncbi:MAG: peptidoglycan-binding protein [Candidatus Omnitrophica bacterium]|nr:peptidoglycan-binding protein [Candidatus Omnitrophota bacterium]